MIITEYDFLELLFFIHGKFKKLPASIRETLIEALVEAETDYIQSLSRTELECNIRTYGLLTKIEEESDYNLIQHCWDKDLPKDNSFYDAISNAYTSVELLALLEEWSNDRKAQLLNANK